MEPVGNNTFSEAVFITWPKQEEEELIEELDLGKHHNSQELAKKINEIIRKTNKNG